MGSSPSKDPSTSCQISPPSLKHLLHLQSQIRANRRLFYGVPIVPTQIREKIAQYFQIESLQTLSAESKLWEVSKPIRFIYSNQPQEQENVPQGLCTIYLYKQNKQFCAFFRGVVNNLGLRQCKGSFYIFQNGDFFIGNKDKNNYGVYHDLLHQYEYQGDWNNGKPHGFGKEKCRKGTYSGYYLNGKKHGKGTWKSIEGVIYEGEFYDNEPSGLGKLLNEKQDYEYNGYFSLGQKSGKGTEKTNTYIYEGNFERNVKMGKGKIRYLSQDKFFEGHFQDGLPNGPGRGIIKGIQVEGLWKNGQLKVLYPLNQ